MSSTTTELPLLWHDVCAFFSVLCTSLWPDTKRSKEMEEECIPLIFSEVSVHSCWWHWFWAHGAAEYRGMWWFMFSWISPQPSKIALQVQNQVFNPRACREHFVFSPKAYVVSCPREIWLPHWVMLLRHRLKWKSEHLLRTPSMFPKQLTDINKIEYFLPLGHFCSCSVHLVYDTSRCQLCCKNKFKCSHFRDLENAYKNLHLGILECSD